MLEMLKSLLLPGLFSSASIMDRLSQMFTLRVKYKDKGEQFTLNFPGSKTVQEVRQVNRQYKRYVI